ncbi:MAG: 3-hydroxyacyl-CoA dehydrogenase family protein [Pirellulaceae bacterium]
MIPVVEMVFGEKTPDAIFQQAYDLMTDIGKIPVRCRDVPGFIGNRLMHAMWREALALVDAGVCTAAEIDRIVKLTFALRLPSLGPMENMDLVGLDAVQRIHRYLLPELADNTQPADCLDDKVRAGHLGMRSGQGFYDWSQRDAEQVVRNRDLLIVRQLALRELGEL